MKILTALSFAATILTAFAAPAIAVPIHSLGDADPTGQFTAGGATNSSRAWQFTVTANDVWVTELGINSPNGQFNNGRSATLWDVTSQTILAQSSFVSGAGWMWNSISGVALANGGEYLIQYHSSFDDYWFGSGLSANWYPAGTITYQDQMHFCNGCAVNTYPTNFFPGGYQFGLADIGYEIRTASNVPEPAPLALIGLGLLAGLAARRLKA